jgi:hypothetical protein
VLVAVYGVYVFFGSDWAGVFRKLFTKSVTQQAGVVYCIWFRLSKDFLLDTLEGTEQTEGSFQTLLRDRRQADAFRLSKDFIFGTLEGTEQTEGSFQTLLRDRRQAGALGGDTEDSVSLQRDDALTGFA